MHEVIQRRGNIVGSGRYLSCCGQSLPDRLREELRPRSPSVLFRLPQLGPATRPPLGQLDIATFPTRTAVHSPGG